VPAEVTAAALVPLLLRDQLAAARSLGEAGHDAAVCIGFENPYTPALFLLNDQRFPVVLFNRRFPWLPLPAVLVDDQAPTRQLVDALVTLGHRNFCMVSHFSAGDSPAGRNMVSAWTDRLCRHGLLKSCAAPLRILPWLPGLGRNKNLFADIFLRPDRPTAVVFTTALWARRFLHDTRIARFRVPDHLSLAVFYPGECRLRTPAGPFLTTVDIDHRRAAQCILEMVGQLLDGRSKPANIRIPPGLRFTDSIGPAPCLP